MVTNEQFSGAYVIDEAFNVVSYNEVIQALYPKIKVGEKCYHCLMGLEHPCLACPVVNNIKGAQVYVDPCRNLNATIDAVPLCSKDAEKKYTALIFGTVEKGKDISEQLSMAETKEGPPRECDYYDKVTGGYSYEGVCREIGNFLSKASEEEYAIVYLDVCNFKAINDLFGYEGGDALLEKVHANIKRMTDCVKVCGRITADRFAVLVDKNKLNMYAIANQMTQKWHYKKRVVSIYLQAGVYIIRDRQMPVESMIDRARIAKNSILDNTLKPYAIFDEKMRDEYVDNAEILADFGNAIDKKEFKVFYQPVIEAKTGKVASAEALVRWQHPKKGLISPNKFIPTIEKSGMISILDRYVVEHVYGKMKERVEEGKPIVPIAINLSWIDLDDDDMKDRLQVMLSENVVPQGYLRFEATERTLASMETMCRNYLSFLRAAGSKLLLDDFGCGYSSFNMIQKYDFDVLKIDRELISSIEKNQKTRKIICAIIAMCHGLGIEVVAEGVETAEEYEFLKENDCDYIQGFYFARPMEAEEFVKFFDNDNRP